MAVKRTDRQRKIVADYVNQLYEMSGAGTIREFAEMSGLYDSNVSEYLSGKSVPDGYNLIRMMATAGVRMNLRSGDVEFPEQSRRRHPAAVQEAVAELLEWQPKVIADLDELRTRLERLETPARARRAKGQ